MRGFIIRIAILGCGLIQAGCASLPAGIATPAEFAARVAGDVCVPYVVDDVPFARARRALDAGWSQDPPELLTSGPAGPVLHRGSADLTIVPERIAPAFGSSRSRACVITVTGSDVPAIVTAIEAVLVLRPVRPRADQEAVAASYCVGGGGARGATIWVLEYPPDPRSPQARRVGLSVNHSMKEGCT